MNKRMVISALSLGGVFLASYLTLYKLGYIGLLACGTGGCEAVQTSKWGTLLGLPVAAWGVGFYLTMCIVATAGALGWVSNDRLVSTLLLWLSGWGVLVSGWLTGIEIVKIEAICRYCVGSAVLVLVLFVVSWMDWAERRSTAD